MTPNLAQVLNTVAHEIRTPLAVSQGYLKLFLDGRLKDGDDTRRAMEQTRQALGTLATLCMDMGKVSAQAENPGGGIPSRLPASDLIGRVRAHESVKHAEFAGDAGGRMIETTCADDLANAVAIVMASAFDEARGEPHAVEASADGALTIVAAPTDTLPAVPRAPDLAGAGAVDFVKGGKGLKLIWAAFVLDKHGVQTWADERSRASVGFRIPLVHA